MDADSERRARGARRLAEKLGIKLTLERLRPDDEGSLSQQSPEATSRRHRYRFLWQLADGLDARFLVTAHHADDQAETVLLRLLFGSGLEGLAGIASERGRLVRPCLGLRRFVLHEALRESGLEAVLDPTNFDLATPRNSVRHQLMPYLLAQEPDLVNRLCHLADAARVAARRIDTLLDQHLEPQWRNDALVIERRVFEQLDPALRRYALALLHRRSGQPYPASAEARRELLRQLRARGRVGCDCGGSWRWEADAEDLWLVRRASTQPEFTYTLEVPGEVELPELSMRFRLARAPVASWMFRESEARAGLAIPLQPGSQVMIRNRRPGDRFQPLGSPQPRRLKDVLINRRVPRARRDSLPLLVVDDEIAWVPGFTISERFRLHEQDEEVWVASIENSRDER